MSHDILQKAKNEIKYTKPGYERKRKRYLDKKRKIREGNKKARTR